MADIRDVGSGRYAAPPDGDDPNARAAWEQDIARVRAAAQTNADVARDAGDHTHTQIQMWLRDLGRALRYDVTSQRTTAAASARPDALATTA